MTDPIDETQPHATSTNPPTSSEPPVASGPPPSSLRVDPDGPKATDWREPAWFPPRDKDRRPNLASTVVGLALVAIGLYFFLDRTLGVAMPRLQWATIWPVILIALGVIVLFRSVSRRS